MLILPRQHRAPFVAPGRRNRKVHWNRQRSRAIASLGKFEREDWRRALWLPESLRAFYPKWNNQFSPGGGTGCGCCETSEEEACEDATNCTSLTVDEYQLDLGTFTDQNCSNCDENWSDSSWIVTRNAGPFGQACRWYYEQGTSSPNCSGMSIQLNMNGGGSADSVRMDLPYNDIADSFIRWDGASTDNDCGNWNLHQFDIGVEGSLSCSTSDPVFATAL